MNVTILKKLGIAVIIIIIYVLVCTRIYNHLENKSEVFYEDVKLKQKSKIYDIIHQNLPSLRNLSTIVDIIPFIPLIIIFFIDLNLFYRVIGLLGTIFIVRMFIIHLTILPKDKKCDIKKSSVYSGGCYDKVYSGHFAVVFTCLLFLYKNNYINIFTLVSLSIITALLIITSRSHYTIDIFVSFLMVIITYQNNLSVCRIIDKFVY